jgi:hypothetical protein
MNLAARDITMSASREDCARVSIGVQVEKIEKE